jgi:peptidoglycan/xylan/chitin deacetylase (PgdA/CDA1 family)
MSLKSGLISALRLSGLAAPLRDRLGGIGAILLLHEIHDDVRSELMTGCSPAQLAEVVTTLRRDGWDIVSIDEALRRIAEPRPGRPFAVLTFDDGYRDNLTRALPILRRLEAPLTVYVPTGAPTRELYAWWLALRVLIRSHDHIVVDGMERSFSCGDLGGKIEALKTVSAWVHEDYRRKDRLAPVFAAYGISLPSVANDYFMSGDELRDFAGDPLVTIGAHTTSHAALSTLDADEVRREMADNRSYLEQLLGRAIVHFAYPYGDARACGAREAGSARALGFQSAVIVEASPIFGEHRTDLHSLPRIAVRPNETPATLYYRASGISWAMNAHKRRRRSTAAAA